MKSVAVITARGGSKRIPRKNIKPFLGKPILEYSIEAALQADLFHEVMVSTDDEEIAQVAKRAGAKVPFFRSEQTSNDYATTAEVLLEVLASYERIGMKFQTVCCIYPTAPFVTAEKLKEAFRLLTENNASGVMPVVRFSFPPQRGMKVEAGRLAYSYPENAMKRSQDLEPYYHDSGQFYLLRVQPFLKEKNMLLKHMVPMFFDEMEVQDIDTQKDWDIAEFKYRMLQEKRVNLNEIRK